MLHAPKTDALPEGLTVSDAPGLLTLGFSGDLNSATVARLWAPALDRVRGDARKAAAMQKGDVLRLQLAQAGYIDGAGLALLVKLRAEAEARGVVVEL